MALLLFPFSSGNRGLKEACALQKCTQRVHGVEGFEPVLDAIAQTQPPRISEEGPIRMRRDVAKRYFSEGMTCEHTFKTLLNVKVKGDER